MNENVAKRLLDINDEFYQSFGQAFAETRRRLQPGVQRVLEERIRAGNWLDIGCGSGILGQRLAKSGFQGTYLGLDFSEPLLAEAKKGIESLPEHPGCKLEYAQANLLDRDWARAASGQTFDGVLAFAALHHIPGAENRLRLIREICGMLKPSGLFIHSEWQFHHSPKLAARVQPWQLAGLDDADVEPGDTLLDWRHHANSETNGNGLRYVHLFDKNELDSLSSSAGFAIIDEFESDGSTGNLGLYQVWRKIE